MGLCFTHLGKNVGQFFTLPLGTNVCAKTTFKELESPFVLGHLQQFHSAFLVWSMSDHFTDQIPHEFCVLGLDPLQPGRANFICFGFAGWDFCCFVAPLQAHCNFVTRCHLTEIIVLLVRQYHSELEFLRIVIMIKR